MNGDRKSAKQTTSFQLNAQVERHVHVSGMAAMMEMENGGVWDVCHSGFTIFEKKRLDDRNEWLMLIRKRHERTEI